MWHRKTRWFVGAAALAIAAGGVTFYRPLVDDMSIESNPPANVTSIIRQGEGLKSEYEAARNNATVNQEAVHMQDLVPVGLAVAGRGPAQAVLGQSAGGADEVISRLS